MKLESFVLLCWRCLHTGGLNPELRDSSWLWNPNFCHLWLSHSEHREQLDWGQCFIPFMQYFTPFCSILLICAVFHPFVQHFTLYFCSLHRNGPRYGMKGIHPQGFSPYVCKFLGVWINSQCRGNSSFLFDFFWGILRFKGSHENLSEGKGEIWIAVNNNRESWGS